MRRQQQQHQQQELKQQHVMLMVQQQQCWLAADGAAAAVNTVVLPVCTHRCCCRVAVTPAMFQARYVAASSASAGPLLAALQADPARKVYSAFKKGLNKKTPASDPAGPQVCPQQQQQKMIYPFIAMGLVVKGTGAQPYKGICTGFLVTDSAVLTAAHCVHDLKMGSTTNPAELRFLPQVIAGKSNTKLNGADGYAVQAVVIPAWFEQLSFYDAASAKAFSSDYHAWDLALLKLVSSVKCNKCTLAPSAVSGPAPFYAYKASFTVAGYVGGAYQLSLSSPCAASLLRDLPVAATRRAADAGQTGGPLLPAATLYDIDPKVPGLPVGVFGYNWPAFGLYTGGITANSNSVMLQFTPAHLKWIYWAGATGASFYDCSAVGLKCKKFKGVAA
jgi:hypothetical protein